MPAASSRRRATLAVGATRPVTGAPPLSHLVLVSQLAEAANTVQPAGDPRQAFCAKLRSTRERRGIPLSTIAAATKVGVAHLAALERNDLSRWPAGIYRRAWIRSYAVAVGLPADATVDEFIAVFDPAPPPPDPPAADAGDEAGPLRLTFAAPRAPWWFPFSVLRTYAVEVGAAVVLAVLIAWVTGNGILVAAGVLALCAFAPLAGAIRRVTSRLRNLRT